MPFDGEDFYENRLPAGSLFVAPAVGFTLGLAAAGAFSALGTLDVIDRHIHYTREPAFLGNEFRDIGLPLAAAGNLSFGATTCPTMPCQRGPAPRTVHRCSPHASPP